MRHLDAVQEVDLKLLLAVSIACSAGTIIILNGWCVGGSTGLDAGTGLMQAQIHAMDSVLNA